MKGGGGGRKASLRRVAPVVGVLSVSADNARLANRAIAIPNLNGARECARAYQCFAAINSKMQPVAASV
jgi:hypothetical protein